MTYLLYLISICTISFSGFSPTKWKKLEPKIGHFVKSKDGPITGPHGLKKRLFSFAAMPSLVGLKKGWNYRKTKGKKHGLQIYIAGSYVSMDYFVNGKKISAASYRKSKPDGWFYQYDNKGKKHGLQHYVSGTYYSLEMYHHGQKLLAGSYRKSRPNGWFYQYGSLRKKHGVQKYARGTYWSVEHYVHGKKHGLSGSYRGRVKDGWHYTYAHGKVISKTYYIKGVAS
jgi:hypothetical protein